MLHLCCIDFSIVSALCTSSMSLLDPTHRLLPHILRRSTIAEVNKTFFKSIMMIHTVIRVFNGLTWLGTTALLLCLLNCVSSMCMLDLAAFVHIARDERDIGDGFPVDGINAR
jgi:hypothetical protein